MVLTPVLIGWTHWFAFLMYLSSLFRHLSVDLPILVRGSYGNNVSAVNLESEMPGHVDIPRLRKGKVGGFFWSAGSPIQS